MHPANPLPQPDLDAACVARPTGKTKRSTRVDEWLRKGPRMAREWIGSFLFGDDVFISYARLDATDYSSALADRLTRLGFACYLDQWTTQPGGDLPAELKAAVRRSGVFVLLASSAALGSESVSKEITEFLPARRPFLLVALIPDVESAVWFPAVKGVARTIDTPGLARGEPSDQVVDRIANAFGVRTRNQRLKRLFWMVLISTSVILGSASLLAHVLVSRATTARAEAIAQLTDAQKQTARAVDERGKAEQQTAEARRLADVNRAEGLLAEGHSLSAAGSPHATSRLLIARRLLQSAGLPTFPADTVLWDHRRRSLALLHAFHTPGAPARRLALSFDGETLALADAPSPTRPHTSVMLWNTRTWERLHDLGSVNWVVNALAFSPDGRWLAAGGALRSREAGASTAPAPRLRLWNLKVRGADRAATAGPEGGLDLGFDKDVHAVAFSGDSRRMAVASGFQISMWDIGGVAPTPTGWTAETPYLVSDLALGHTGDWLAAAGIGRSPIYALRCVDAPCRDAPEFPGGSVGVIRALALSSNPFGGYRLAWAGNDVRIVDDRQTRSALGAAGTRRLLPEASVWQLSFLERGQRLMALVGSPAEAAKLRVWSAYDGHQEYLLEDQPDSIVAATAMGPLIVAADAHGGIYAWTTRNVSQRSIPRPDRPERTGVSFRLKNLVLLVTGERSTPARLFDVATGFPLPAKPGGCCDAAVPGASHGPASPPPTAARSPTAETLWQIQADGDSMHLWNTHSAPRDPLAIRLSSNRHASFRAEEKDWREMPQYPFRVSGVTASSDGGVVAATVTSSLLILDLALEARRSELQGDIRRARQVLRGNRDDREALRATGVWFALIGADDAAIAWLRRARTAGAVIDPVLLARALWRQSKRERGPVEHVVAEFDRAIREAADDDERQYLALCRDAAATSE